MMMAMVVVFMGSDVLVCCHCLVVEWINQQAESQATAAVSMPIALIQVSKMVFFVVVIVAVAVVVVVVVVTRIRLIRFYGVIPTHHHHNLPTILTHCPVILFLSLSLPPSLPPSLSLYSLPLGFQS